MELSVVLPAYNEGGGIRGVAEELARELRKVSVTFEVIVVNNGSTDNTTVVLCELQKTLPELVVVTVFPNKGFGNGILAGLAQARGRVLGWMPGDGQLRSDDFVRGYTYLKKGAFDVVKGIRVIRNDSPFRLLQSKVYNTFFKTLFGVPYSDINAPPKLFTRPVYHAVKLVSKDWFLDAELILKAHAGGYHIGEAPLSGHLREWGSSKVIKLLTVCEFIKNMLKYRLHYAEYQTKKGA